VILLIDNYDSFVHNLARYFRRLGQETLVVRNDTVDVVTVRGQHPAAAEWFRDQVLRVLVAGPSS
jgi:anthranilate/para-aminobenzoate synthase component II